MRRAGLFWATTIGALVGVDYWCAKNATTGDSLSECTRAFLRTDTSIGAAAFVTAWGALSVWIVPHILRPLAIEAANTIGASHVHIDHPLD